MKKDVVNYFTTGLVEDTFGKAANPLLRQALEACPEFATQAAVYGSDHGQNDQAIRWLVWLSTLDNKDLFKQAFARIIRDPDQLYSFVKLVKSGDIRKGISRSIKAVINRWLAENLNDALCSRYKRKLQVVVKTAHPAFAEAELQRYMQYLCRGDVVLARDVAKKQVIASMTNGYYTHEEQILMEEHRFSYEELKHAASNLRHPTAKQRFWIDLFRFATAEEMIQLLPVLERAYAFWTHNEIRMARYNYTAYKWRVIDRTNVPHNVRTFVLTRLGMAVENGEIAPLTLYRLSTQVVTPEFKDELSELMKHAVFSKKSAEPSSVLVGVDVSCNYCGQDISERSRVVGAMLFNTSNEVSVVAIANTTRELVPYGPMAAHFIHGGAPAPMKRLMPFYKGQKTVVLLTYNEAEDSLLQDWLAVNPAEDAKLIVWQPYSERELWNKVDNVEFFYGYSDHLFDLLCNAINGYAEQIEAIEKVVL
jgi:60 kDa SS-A/Ro ribonucleoprotein